MWIIIILSCLIGSDSSIIHVSGRTGSDETGKGTIEAPFRSVTRALDAVDAESAAETVVRLDYGTYGPGTGEKLPLKVPAGLKLEGLVAGATILDGEGGDLLLSLEKGGSPTCIEGLTLQNGKQGIACKGGSLVLSGVVFSDLEQGLLLQGETRASGESLRFTGCREGIHLSGEAPLKLELRSCLFSKGVAGIFLEGATAEGKGVHHSIRVEDTIFSAYSEAGILRQGEDGKNRSDSSYRFEGCTFLRNRMGLKFERPAGDSPLTLRGCAFLENEIFGVRIIGAAGDTAKRSSIEECAFQWNGVGLQVMSTQVVFEVRRNRITDNLGNGVFCGNILAEPTLLLFTDNLIAHNGAGGILCLSDGRSLEVKSVNNTVVYNGDFGIKRHNKHGGESVHEIRNSIIYGNLNADLVRIAEGEILHCLVGEDPGFMDPLSRDYRLKPDSPCRDKGKEHETFRAGAKDLDGKKRRSGPIDLGAFEYGN